MSTTTAHLPTRPIRPAGATPHYRLTRRGRLVVLALSVLVALAAMVVIAGGSVATSTEGADVPTETVLVSPGDTLWALASDAAGDGDVRDMMTRIERLNGLEGGQVAAGEKIFVPLD